MDPNAFVIGTPKAGTTSLASYLRQHPDILVSTPKETCFHFREYEKGLTYYRNTFFPGYKKQSVVCDMSILNMYYCETTAPRIAKDFPEAKLIAVLRDPIQRAFSDYRESVNKGVETLRFEKTLAVEQVRRRKDDRAITQNMYFSRGLYGQQLDVFLRYFSKESIKIILYENFRENPSDSINEIFDFLKVEGRKDIDTSFSRNVNTSKVRSARLQNFLRGEHLLADVVKQMAPAKYRNGLSSFAKKLKEMNRKPYEKEEGIPSEFQEVLRSYFRESNLDLKKTFHLDLSPWNT